MEPTKVLASGLTLEESKAKRQEKQAARYRHRLGTYVPSGDSKGLLEALMATSPRKSPTRKSVKSGSMKPRKSIKSRNDSSEVADKSTQEMKGRPKPRKATSRKSTKTTDLDEEVNQVKRSDKDASRRTVGKNKMNTVEDEVEGPGPSTSRGIHRTGIVNPEAPKSSKKSATTKNPKRPKPSSRATDADTDVDNQPIAPEPPKTKPKKSSMKPPPTQTDDESDDLAIRGKKSFRKADKGKGRVMDSPVETFESAGTDADSHPGPPDRLSVEGRALCDPPPDAHKTTTAHAIPRVASVPEEPHKQRPKKRGRPRNDEGGREPPPKRGKTQKTHGSDEGEDATITESVRQSKKPPTKARSRTTKGRTRKKIDHPPEMSDAEGDGSVASETRTPGSDTRKRQQRKIDNGSDDEKQEKTDLDEASSNLSRVRLDNIPPEGIVIRKKNGIVERLLPPTNKPKKKTRGGDGGSRKRAIPAHVLKYIGPTRIGSPLKGEGTDTDDDLNL